MDETYDAPPTHRKPPDRKRVPPERVAPAAGCCDVQWLARFGAYALGGRP